MSKRCVLSTAFVILGGCCFIFMVVMFFEFARAIPTMLDWESYSRQSPWPVAIGVGGEIIALGLLAFALIFRSDKLAQWLVVEDETVTVRPSSE